ncbi:MAG: glycosyltransferase family 1 protein [Chloroflexi bacterium]|nr:MAG: glycosyltransferase family 1 protein [Chloroflexota bacterium]
MKSYTILMLSNLYPPVVSGSSTQTAALSRELVKRGHKVIIITARVNPDSPEYEDDHGVLVYRLPALRLPKLTIYFNFPWLSYTFTRSNIRRITNIVNKHKPDVIHLHNHMFDFGLSASFLRKRTKIPLVITLHTVIRHSSRFYNFFLLPIDRLVLKPLIVDHADQVLCPDFNIKRYAQEIFKRDNPIIVPYGIDTNTRVNDAKVKELCERYGLEGKHVILSLGHVHEIRNRKDLILALPKILEVFPNTVLLLIGAISTDTPSEIARKLKVNDALVFCGPVVHDDISHFLYLADLEAHWLNQEAPERTSLGIASLEAMAAGRTILAAANPDTYGKGVLTHDENVIIVQPDSPDELANTIIDLLRDDVRRAAIGHRARQTILDHFSWDSVCEQTVQVYESVIKK